MPIYEYTCTSCGETSEALVYGYDPLPDPTCAACGALTQRLVSLVALGHRVDPGPGRVAWPTTWRAVNGGDPDTLRYWQQRIELELREEERNPELRARADRFQGAAGGHSQGEQTNGLAPEPYIGPAVGEAGKHAARPGPSEPM